MRYTLEAVAHVRSRRMQAEDDNWDAVEASIELAEGYSEEALMGLEAFSHVVVVYLFDQVAPSQVVCSARHPRNNPDWPKVGIFAQRGRKRPNRLGVTTCALLGVAGRSLLVRGLDAIDGTPVLDIKPWMESFGPRGVRREPSWVKELMADYWCND